MSPAESHLFLLNRPQHRKLRMPMNYRAILQAGFQLLKTPFFVKRMQWKDI